MSNISVIDAARELLRRRGARSNLADYISYAMPEYVHSDFTRAVCRELDIFIERALDGERPVLVLNAPPQHGKSEIVSRKFPAYLMSRYPALRIGAASYAKDLAGPISQSVRRTLASDEHQRLWPLRTGKSDRLALNRIGEFNAPLGPGSYVGVGVGGPLTGRPVDIGIIDDPVRNARDALSPTIRDSVWDWYMTVFRTRLSKNSGTIIMATAWTEDDLTARIIKLMGDDPRFKHLKFPAISDDGQALCPHLHPLEKLLEDKKWMSAYWWSAMYQQSPTPLGGAVFIQSGIRYYTKSELPAKFDKIITSWDCTFKDTDGSDYVVGQVWGRAGEDAYLLYQHRARMTFTETLAAIESLEARYPENQRTLIEDKANGPAVIDMLRSRIRRILPVEPDGSKLARAHAITYLWESGCLHIPHPDTTPWVKDFISEILSFDRAPHDDQVDAMTQAVRHLYPLRGRLAISTAALDRARGIRR